MSSDVVKKCRSCGYEVDPKHTGKCPNCGNVGYQITVTVNEVVKISDRLDVVKNQLNKAYDKQLEKLEEKRVKIKDAGLKAYFNRIIELVNAQKQQEVFEFSERLNTLKELQLKESETHKKTFTIDAVLAETPTEKEVDKSVQKNVKLSVQEVLEQMGIDIKEIKETTSQTHTKVSMLSSRKTLLLGLGIGVGGSSIAWFLTTVLPNLVNNVGSVIIVNGTNSTI